ncbi:MAG TPA: AbrB/MazE/SpoVT family DNA-binding domain-containing protein [Candidatus Sulfotelmatobacter sp.]|nr:AbrB/MazE/SpoVT family DNA-binding domain-containing protein [Candidatus Sulfotelmatobacter sp.]
MKYSRTIDGRGRITVPREIRRRLGLSAGGAVEFIIEGEQCVLRAPGHEKDVFAKYRGILRRFPRGEKGIKGWIDEMRATKMMVRVANDGRLIAH